MELWIKDLKYFKAGRTSCHTFCANCFRLFLYAAAFVTANNIKRTLFKDTEVEEFAMDSFIKLIMLSSKDVYKDTGVIADESIKLIGLKISKWHPEEIRMVTYEENATGNVYRFSTNNREHEALAISELCRER